MWDLESVCLRMKKKREEEDEKGKEREGGNEGIGVYEEENKRLGMGVQCLGRELRGYIREGAIRTTANSPWSSRTTDVTRGCHPATPSTTDSIGSFF